MNSFIEEFYYGNIDPQARSSEQNKKVQRDMQTLNESEDFLTDKLSERKRNAFSNTSMPEQPSTVNPPSTASSQASASAPSSHLIPSSPRKYRMWTT